MFDFFKVHNNFSDITDVKSVLMYGERKSSCEVSIMIPTYLRNDLLDKTIRSAIYQECSISYEVVVVDNNDHQEDLSTLQIIQNYSPQDIAYYKNAINIGMFGNMNRCLELAAGEWVLILHDDDYIEQNYVEKMYESVKKVGEVGGIGCDLYAVDENENSKSRSFLSFIYEWFEKFFKRDIAYIELRDLYYWHPFNIAGLLINKEKAFEIGGFDPKLHPISDYAFILNMVNRYGMACLEKPLIAYRVACNATLSYENIVKMVELSALLRECVGKKLNLSSEKYAATYTISEENEKISGWTMNLTQEEKDSLISEFRNFNKKMNYKIENDSLYYRFLRVAYGFYVRKIRKCKKDRVSLL